MLIGPCFILVLYDQLAKSCNILTFKISMPESYLKVSIRIE